jgi:hypothetical protein
VVMASYNVGSSLASDMRSRIEYNTVRKGRHQSDLCTLTVSSLMCSPFLYAFSNPTLSSLLTEMSSKEPGLQQCWPRCLNLNTTIASESQKTPNTIWNACLHLPHAGFCTSCINTLSWFCLKLSNWPAFLEDGPLRKPSASHCPELVCQCLCFLLI